MVFNSTFVSTVTSKKYYIRGNFTCTSTDVIYLVEWIVNVNMLGLQLLLNNVSVFISQILEPRKFVVGLLGNLILFDAIQRFHCIYASVYTRCVARPNQASRGEFFCEYSWWPKAVNCFHKNTSSCILLCSCYATVYILNT